MVKILFVCMGNICRSPTAEGVFRHRVQQAGLQDQIQIDSAGTHAYHVGEPPDERAQEAAQSRGFDLGGQHARRVAVEDFERFDYVLPMDESNRYELEAICPEGHEHKVRLFLEFARDTRIREVPDPYYGGGRGFETVLDLVENASDGLLAHIRENHLS